MISALSGVKVTTCMFLLYIIALSFTAYCSMSDYLSRVTGELVSGVRSGRDRGGGDKSSSKPTTVSLGVIRAAARLPCAARGPRLAAAGPVYGAPCMTGGAQAGALLALDITTSLLHCLCHVSMSHNHFLCLY